MSYNEQMKPTIHSFGDFVFSRLWRLWAISVVNMGKWYYKYSSKDGSIHTGSREFDRLKAAKEHVQSLPDFDSLGYVALTPLDDSNLPSPRAARFQYKDGPPEDKSESLSSKERETV